MPDQARTQALAVAVLRISLGVIFLAHSVLLKLLTFGLPGTATYFRSFGLPGWLAYPTFAAEVIGGIRLILGIQSRWVALALTPILTGAAVVHVPNGWLFGAPGGGWEYPAYLALLALVQAMLGDGALALNPSVSLRTARLVPETVR